MKTVIAITLAILCGSSVLAERTITDRSLHAFWAQFKDGEETINVYAHMESLLLAYPEGGGRTTILQWNGSAFVLYLSNARVSDLVTSEDNFGRPPFAGKFDAQGTPQVTGFVDVTPAGNLLIELSQEDASPEVTARRFEVNADDGVAVALGVCACGSGVGRCRAIHCDTLLNCPFDPLGFCEWSDTVITQ